MKLSGVVGVLDKILSQYGDMDVARFRQEVEAYDDGSMTVQFNGKINFLDPLGEDDEDDDDGDEDDEDDEDEVLDGVITITVEVEGSSGPEPQAA